MFGLTRDGFKRKRYADIRADLEIKWKELFGENSRTDERSVNGKIISLIAHVASPIWMLAERVYNNSFVHKAEGRALDGLVENKLIYRRRAEKAVGTIEIRGQPGTIIEAGFWVSNNRVIYTTVEDVEIGSSGVVLAKIEAQDEGSQGNTTANTITEIVTPVFGVESVNNPDPVLGGRDEETDVELKERYDRSFGIGGSTTIPSIEAALLALPRVRDARIFENTTMNEVNGIPPKSIAPFIFGGDDEEIANTIFLMKPGGIRSYGTTEITIADSRGEQHIIGFTRPDTIQIYVHVELKTDGNFPINGYEQVRTKIIEYIGGYDEDATEYNGLGLGEDVIYTKIIAAIQQIDGVVDIPVLLVDTQDPPTATGNIEIAINEVAQTDFEKVSVSEFV